MKCEIDASDENDARVSCGACWKVLFGVDDSRDAATDPRG